jgi:hypothetical protein
LNRLQCLNIQDSDNRKKLSLWRNQDCLQAINVIIVYKILFSPEVRAE